MAQPVNPETGRLRGEVPDTFTGERSKADIFKRQFKIYQGLNDNHEIMLTPYYRAMQFLALIKGPLVDDWVGDQIETLMTNESRPNNPIPKDNRAHWTALQTAFDAAFTDTDKQQKSHLALQQLRMNGDDLDSYVATFKHLANKAGYTLNKEGTKYLFALGLKGKAYGRSLAPRHPAYHL